MDEKKWGVVLGVIVLAAVGGWLYVNRPVAPPVAEALPDPVAEAPAIAPAPPTPADYPVPAAASASPPLPVLDESDAGFRSALSALLGNGAFEAFFVPERLIRRIVVTIDNLPRERMAPALMPVRRTPPPLRVQAEGGRTVLSRANGERYAPAIAIFKALDPAAVVALYFRWYPLFQRAYVDLGYPDRSFNNRLVEVLDHLLATPEAPAEIELVQPKVAYEFADPKLEALSAGQKLILRLGATQRADVMAQLRAIRTAVVAGSAATKR